MMNLLNQNLFRVKEKPDTVLCGLKWRIAEDESHTESYEMLFPPSFKLLPSFFFDFPPRIGLPRRIVINELAVRVRTVETDNCWSMK